MLSFEEYCWLDLFCVMFVKGKMFGFQRKCCQNFVKTPVLVLTIN